MVCCWWKSTRTSRQNSWDQFIRGSCHGSKYFVHQQQAWTIFYLMGTLEDRFQPTRSISCVMQLKCSFLRPGKNSWNKDVFQLDYFSFPLPYHKQATSFTQIPILNFPSSKICKNIVIPWASHSTRPLLLLGSLQKLGPTTAKTQFGLDVGTQRWTLATLEFCGNNPNQPLKPLRILRATLEYIIYLSTTHWSKFLSEIYMIWSLGLKPFLAF